MTWLSEIEARCEKATPGYRVLADGRVGEIESLMRDGNISIFLGKGHSSLVKPSQCIPLKKKKRFEVWVNVYPDESTVSYQTKEKADEMCAHDRIACYRMVKAKDQR